MYLGLTTPSKSKNLKMAAPAAHCFTIIIIIIISIIIITMIVIIIVITIIIRLGFLPRSVRSKQTRIGPPSP